MNEINRLCSRHRRRMVLKTCSFCSNSINWSTSMQANKSISKDLKFRLQIVKTCQGSSIRARDPKYGSILKVCSLISMRRSSLFLRSWQRFFSLINPIIVARWAANFRILKSVRNTWLRKSLIQLSTIKWSNISPSTRVIVKDRFHRLKKRAICEPLTMIIICPYGRAQIPKEGIQAPEEATGNLQTLSRRLGIQKCMNLVTWTSSRWKCTMPRGMAIQIR